MADRLILELDPAQQYEIRYRYPPGAYSAVVGQPLPHPSRVYLASLECDCADENCKGELRESYGSYGLVQHYCDFHREGIDE